MKCPMCESELSVVKMEDEVFIVHFNPIVKGRKHKRYYSCTPCKAKIIIEERDK